MCQAGHWALGKLPPSRSFQSGEKGLGNEMQINQRELRAHLRGTWLEGSAFQRALPEHSLGSQVKGGAIPSTHLEVQQLRGGGVVVGKSRFHTSSFPFLIHPFFWSC